MEINISILAAAHRTKWWKRFYDSIITDLNVEIIFVGENRPDFELFPNFKYVYSPVKPAQCFEIARRLARGELIHWAADDFTYSPHAFDRAFELYKSLNDYKSIIGFNFIEDGVNVTKTHWTPCRTYFLSAAGLINRKFIDELGGIDRRFICGILENDLMMRAYTKGATMHFCNDGFAYEDHIKNQKEEANFAEFWEFEVELFRKLWYVDNKITLKRTQPVEPFEKEDLLTISQSNKGKWI